MIECCLECRKNLHVIMGDATGKPFTDLASLVSGKGRIITTLCRDDDGTFDDFGKRSVHFKYDGSCDFCLIHGIEWRYFYRTLDCGIPRNYWDIVEGWLMARISEGALIRQDECAYFDTMLVNSIN